MKTLIFSDLHDNQLALDRLLVTAERQDVDQLIYLGDVGHNPDLFRRLQEAAIPCVFGNWEVSGLRRLPVALRDWVARWPAAISMGDVIATHASPDVPASVASTAQAAEFMRAGMGWHTLFPRLDRNEDAVWRALAVMEEKRIRVAFHGHTHVQKIWVWTSQDDVRRLAAMSEQRELTLAPGPEHAPSRYIIGVGSLGQPHDGARGRYAIYDINRAQVYLCALNETLHPG